MNTYELDENMVNWINNNMNEYKQIPASEDPRYLTEAHMVFKDACSEEVMEWSNEKKIELGRCIWTMVWLDQEYKPEDFGFIHNLIVLESVSLFFGSIE